MSDREVRTTEHVARLTIEAETGISAATGALHPLFDTLLQRDANGLPCVMGTGIAGVLRRLAARRLGEATAKALFGYGQLEGGGPDGGPDGGEAGGAGGGGMARSRVTVSDALCHLSDGTVLDGFVPAPPVHDPLFGILAAAQPVVRDHVRLDDRGTVDGRGKFERTHVPAGARFSLVLGLRGAETEADWTALLGALDGAVLHLGGATRRGLGRVKVTGLEARRYDLATPAGRRGAQAARRLDRPLAGGEEEAIAAVARPAASAIRLLLRPEAGSPFRFGSERGLALEDTNRTKGNVLRINTEPRISWEGGHGRVRGEGLAEARSAAVAPGTAIKGPLRHRTLFHLRRLLGETVARAPARAGQQGRQTARTGDGEAAPTRAEAALVSLFGEARGTDGGRAGRVRIDDVRLAPVAVSTVTRVSIDRFTGGAIEGALYTEERVEASGAALEVVVELEDWSTLEPAVQRAFRMAVEDLCEGRLALGAGGGKGQGWFEGECRPDDGIAWQGAQQ